MATSRSEVIGTVPSLRKDVVDASPPFHRVLVANRGEVAVRIIRACRELGMEAVAIYSDPDASARHVRIADQAIRVGTAPPSDSYLRIDRIVAAAEETGCDAIHPGYGFLAERAAFAGAVEHAGLAFVGPSSASIEALGDKLNARRFARDAGVPVVPGSLQAVKVDRPDEIASVIEGAVAIGFPLLVKAAAGGGGRGMRRVTAPAELPATLAAGAREAADAFGDGSVYLEREIVPARHIEVQLLGDATGRVIAIGERDCSLQRRHQKLVEEAPAPGLTREERQELHEMAVRVATAAGLVNAATAEFLRSPDGGFYFLEINTRLQVEHGVTELVSGLDIVREQFWLAAGRPLSGEAIQAAEGATDPESHAIEVRISAEDPARDFAPTPGVVRHWEIPAGPGVRVDTAVTAGDRVPPDYDNLIAKLMVHAGNRAAAIRRLARAVDETEIAGIQTTLPFHRFVVRNQAFRDGELSTGWVGEWWDGPTELGRATRTAMLAAGLDALQRGLVPSATGGYPPPATISRSGWDDDGWTRAGREAATDRWPR